MILSEDNIRFDNNIILECIDEMKSLDNKEKFFNDMVRERLNKCNDCYVNEFEEKIDNLVERVLSSNDLKTIGRAMIKLSKMAGSLCSTEITLYRALEM